MSWLEQVQKAADRVPPWFLLVTDHPMFLSLDREWEAPEKRWRIVTREEVEFRDDDVRAVFQAFIDHYGLGLRGHP